MTNQFQFYDEVVVVDRDVNSAAVIGKLGTILGMVKEENSGLWIYSVALRSSGEVHNFAEYQLVATGVQRESADFYSGDTIQVKVDPESGAGTVDK